MLTLRQKTEAYCSSLKNKKTGFTACNKCEPSIRNACHSTHGVHSFEQIEAWRKRVDEAFSWYESKMLPYN